MQGLPRIGKVPLVLGGLASTGIMLFVLIYVLTAWWSTPLFGFGASGPDQPIAFPHNVHVDDEGIACEFCHRNVVSGEAATVPAVEQCLLCHTTVTGESNIEIAKLLEYAGRDKFGRGCARGYTPAHRLGEGAPYPRPCAVCPRTSRQILHPAAECNRNGCGKRDISRRAGVHHVPRRCSGDDQDQTGAELEDGRLRGLPSRLRCPHRLHHLPLLEDR